MQWFTYETCDGSEDIQPTRSMKHNFIAELTNETNDFNGCVVRAKLAKQHNTSVVNLVKSKIAGHQNIDKAMLSRAIY